MKEFDLGPAGYFYLRDVLGRCVGASHLLLSRISGPARVFAPLPSTTNADIVGQFEQGGIASEQRPEEWLFQDITKRRPGTLVIHDTWSKVTDVTVRAPRTNSFFTDGVSVYYYTTSVSATMDELSSLLRQVGSFDVVCFLVDGFPQLLQEELAGGQVSVDFLQQIVNSALVVYASAFDRESWVVWEKQIT
jgi:hypothetical protein